MSSVDNKSAAPSREIKHYRIHRATSDDKNGLEDVHPLASIATFGKWYHFYVLIFDKIKGEGVGCVRYRFYRKTFDDICPILNSLVGVPKWHMQFQDSGDGIPVEVFVDAIRMGNEIVDNENGAMIYLNTTTYSSKDPHYKEKVCEELKEGKNGLGFELRDHRKAVINNKEDEKKYKYGGITSSWIFTRKEHPKPEEGGNAEADARQGQTGPST